MPTETTVERYRDAFLALLPPGRAFAKSLDSNIAKLLEGLSVEPARIHENAEAVLRNALPSTASEMLDEWEYALGLPGDCVTSPSTVESDRQGAAAAKLRGRTSHAQSAFEAVAEDLGYTDLEFVRFAPFEVGVSSVGDGIYGDEWMNVVRAIVPVGDQTADEELACFFVDQLRRSHGFVDVVLEGPMGATRVNTVYINATNNMGADISPTAAFSIQYGGHVSFQVRIHNGAGAAPSDTPVGVWRIYASSNGTDFFEVTDAGSDTGIADQLALIAPNGNNLVEKYATFDNFPGTSGKIVYDRTSGGGTNASAYVAVTTW